MDRVAKLPGVTTLALHQSSFGTSYPKPTRLLLLGTRQLPDFCYVGLPVYDDDGSYIGPLPRLQNQPSMRDRATTGPFNTTGTEQRPIRMCQWIAATLLGTCSAPATTEADKKTGDSGESYPICKPEGHRLQGGKGPPRLCETVSGYKDHDASWRAMFAEKVEKRNTTASRWG